MPTVHFVDVLIQDLRFAARRLLKSPALSAIIVVTLALGIGANTAIFGVVNGFLLRPLPVPHPEQIVALAIQQKDAPVGSSASSYPELVDLRNQADVFSSVFAVVLGQVQISTHDQQEQCTVNYVSKGFFSDLNIAPAAGRLLLPNEGETPGEPLLVVLGYSYWQRRFRGDPSVVGRQIRVDSKPATIVGVVPRKFQGMYSIFEMDAYLPLSALATAESSRHLWTNRDWRPALTFGRLKPGITLARAQSSLDVITTRLAAQYPATDKWYNVRAVPEKLARPIPYANNAFVVISGIFLVLAGLVLLLACINVENILLARGAARQREMAIRAALGAGRARLISQTIAECVLLSLLGGAAGALLGFWVGQLMSSIHLKNLPLHLDASFDWRAFAFTTASALGAGLVVGLLPALRASSADVNEVLQERGRQNAAGLDHVAVRNFLVIAQVAGSLALLVTAGLFVRSLQKVQSFHLGFDPGHVLNVLVDPHEAGYDRPRTIAFYRELESTISALPGVQSASLASYIPVGGWPNKTAVWIDGQPIPPGQHAPNVLFNRIDAPYFGTLRVPLLRGREFSDSDNETAPAVAIINQTMAAHFWPREDAVGKRFSIASEQGPFLEVVGVTADGKYQTLAEDAQPFFYVPLAQNFVSRRALQIRTLAAPESLATAVEEQIRQLAPDLAIMDLETMNQSLAGAFGFFAFRAAAILAGVLGLIGLTLAVVGVYGIVSFAASQRTREIGIRMALGANSRDVLRLVWKQGVRLVLAGVLVGVLAAWTVARAMAILLAGISVNDPVTYLAVSTLLLAVGLVACWIPARRAMRVDPMVALRYE